MTHASNPMHNRIAIGEIWHEGNPKRVRNLILFFSPPQSATEIRCQEKSKGGLRYEVILAEPNVGQVQAPKVVQQNAAPKPLSAQEIAEKLKAAEERRLVSVLDFQASAMSIYDFPHPIN